MTSSENLGVAAQNGWEPAMQTYNGSCHCGAVRFSRSYPDSYVVNVRCLDDFDLETAKYEVKLFDGRNFEAAQQARLASASSTPNASGR